MNRFAQLVRKNVYLEAAAYITQNLLRINNQGGGSFGVTQTDIFDYYCSTLDLYVSKRGVASFCDKVVLEIGPGISLCGALEAVRRYDVKRMYCYDRYNRISEDEVSLIRNYGLTKYMDRVTYFTGPPTELSRRITKNEISTSLSNAVLEFVPDVGGLFHELNKCSAVGALSFHRIDLKCHNKFRSAGDLFFHTFSKRMWGLMGDNVGQLNRLSLDEYVKNFELHGFSIEGCDSKTYPQVVLKQAAGYLSDFQIKKLMYSDADFILKKKRDHFNN